MFAETDSATRHRVWGELSYALHLVSNELATYEQITVWSGPAATARSWRAQHLRSQTEQLTAETNHSEFGS